MRSKVNIGIYEAKQKLNSIVSNVEQSGEDVILTRHGKPVAKIVRVVSEDEQSARLQAIQDLMNFGKLYGKMQGVTPEELKAMIREDRESH